MIRSLERCSRLWRSLMTYLRTNKQRGDNEVADMKDKKEETIHQEEEAVKAEDVTETAETAESAEKYRNIGG